MASLPVTRARPGSARRRKSEAAFSAGRVAWARSRADAAPAAPGALRQPDGHGAGCGGAAGPRSPASAPLQPGAGPGLVPSGERQLPGWAVRCGPTQPCRRSQPGGGVEGGSGQGAPLAPRTYSVCLLVEANLIHEPLVVFVCATAGQGDPPDNMKVRPNDTRPPTPQLRPSPSRCPGPPRVLAESGTPPPESASCGYPCQPL